MTKQFIRRQMLWLPLFLSLGWLTACHSTRASGTTGFASVNITNRSWAEIKLAATQVFQADGYVVGVATPGAGELVFEKQGSRMNQFAYGGLISTQENDSTWIRVRATVTDLGSGAQRLQC